jgi:hypothetical protein
MRSLTAFLSLVFVAVTAWAPAARAQQSYSVDTSHVSPLTGLWWNPTESGWGLTLTQQSNVMFATLFVYDASGNATWYTASCQIAGNNCSGDLLRVRGGATPTAPWAGSNISASLAGSIAFNFSSNDSASMSYTLDSVNASKQISRQIFGPPPPAPARLTGSWQGATLESRVNCSEEINDGNYGIYGQYDIFMTSGSSGSISITHNSQSGTTCSYSGNFLYSGTSLAASGTLSCDDGRRGNWQSTRMTALERSMSIELNLQLNTTETCSVRSVIGGSHL